MAHLGSETSRDTAYTVGVASLLIWLPGILLLLLGLWAVLLYRGVMAPIHAIHAGQYERAARLVVRPSLLDRAPSIRHAKRYNLALALCLDGQLERAAEVLAELPPGLDRNLEYARASLTATLAGLRGDPRAALTEIQVARALRDTPGDAWLEAVVRRALGDEPGAERAAAQGRALGTPGVVLGIKTVLVHGAELERVGLAYLMGRFAELGGADADAREAYAAAAGSPIPSIYRTRAREALPQVGVPSAAREEPEPSTLAPHVLSRR